MRKRYTKKQSEVWTVMFFGILLGLLIFLTVLVGNHVDKLEQIRKEHYTYRIDAEMILVVDRQKEIANEWENIVHDLRYSQRKEIEADDLMRRLSVQKKGLDELEELIEDVSKFNTSRIPLIPENYTGILLWKMYMTKYVNEMSELIATTEEMLNGDNVISPPTVQFASKELTVIQKKAYDEKRELDRTFKLISKPKSYPTKAVQREGKWYIETDTPRFGKVLKRSKNSGYKEYIVFDTEALAILWIKEHVNQ